MTTARDTAEVLESRGTAATVDVQTSTSDSTAGSALLVGGFGLGGDGVDISGDLDATTSTGFYKIGTGATNTPSGANINGSTLVHIAFDGNAASQTYYEYQSNVSYSRRKTGAATWTTWSPEFSEANLNVNYFSGTNQRVAVGYAKSSTEALFYLPVSSYSPAVSVTILGNFIAKTVADVDRSTAQAPVLVGETSDKVVVLLVNTTGATTGETLTLHANSSAAVQVNF